MMFGSISISVLIIQFYRKVAALERWAPTQAEPRSW